MALSINKKYRALFFDKPANRKALDMIIIHSTASNNTKGTLEWFQNPKNTAQSSAHYVVSRDGVIYQMLEEEEVAYHAGKSEWFVNNKLRTNINYYSIGIEVACDQTSVYTPLQLQSLVELANDIMVRRKIKLDNVLRHSDISPNRKKDPYPPNLDWAAFKTKLTAPVELPPLETTEQWRLAIRNFVKQEHLIDDVESFVKNLDPDRFMYFVVRSNPELSKKLTVFLDK